MKSRLNESQKSLISLPDENEGSLIKVLEDLDHKAPQHTESKLVNNLLGLNHNAQETPPFSRLPHQIMRSEYTQSNLEQAREEKKRMD